MSANVSIQLDLRTNADGKLEILSRKIEGAGKAAGTVGKQLSDGVSAGVQKAEAKLNQLATQLGKVGGGLGRAVNAVAPGLSPGLSSSAGLKLGAAGLAGLSVGALADTVTKALNAGVQDAMQQVRERFAQDAAAAKIAAAGGEQFRSIAASGLSMEQARSALVARFGSGAADEAEAMATATGRPVNEMMNVHLRGRDRGMSLDDIGKAVEAAKIVSATGFGSFDDAISRAVGMGPQSITHDPFDLASGLINAEARAAYDKQKAEANTPEKLEAYNAKQAAAFEERKMAAWDDMQRQDGGTGQKSYALANINRWQYQPVSEIPGPAFAPRLGTDPASLREMQGRLDVDALFQQAERARKAQADKQRTEMGAATKAGAAAAESDAVNTKIDAEHPGLREAHKTILELQRQVREAEAIMKRRDGMIWGSRWVPSSVFSIPTGGGAEDAREERRDYRKAVERLDMFMDALYKNGVLKVEVVNPGPSEAVR